MKEYNCLRMSSYLKCVKDAHPLYLLEVPYDTGSV